MYLKTSSRKIVWLIFTLLSLLLLTSCGTKNTEKLTPKTATAESQRQAQPKTEKDIVNEFVKSFINDCIDQWSLKDDNGNLLRNNPKIGGAKNGGLDYKKAWNLLSTTKLCKYLDINNPYEVIDFLPANDISWNSTHGVVSKDYNLSFVKLHSINIDSITQDSSQWYTVNATWYINVDEVGDIHTYRGKGRFHVYVSEDTMLINGMSGGYKETNYIS